MNSLNLNIAPSTSLPAPHQYLEKGSQGQIIITDLVVPILAPISHDFAMEALNMDMFLNLTGGSWYEVTISGGISPISITGTIPPNMQSYPGKWDRMRFRIKKLPDGSFENKLYVVIYESTSKTMAQKVDIDELTFDEPVRIWVNEGANQAILYY